MSCSTYTVRSCSLGGKPSTLPFAMARMRVDCSSFEPPNISTQVSAAWQTKKAAVVPAGLTAVHGAQD